MTRTSAGGAIADAKRAEELFREREQQLTSLVESSGKVVPSAHTQRASVEDLLRRMTQSHESVSTLRRDLEGERDLRLGAKRTESPFSGSEELRKKIGLLKQAREMARDKDEKRFLDHLEDYKRIAGELPLGGENLKYVSHLREKGGLRGLADEVARNPMTPHGSHEWEMELQRWKREIEGAWAGALEDIQRRLAGLEGEEDRFVARHESKLSGSVDEELTDEAAALTEVTAELNACFEETGILLERELSALEMALGPWRESLEASRIVNRRAVRLDEEDRPLVEKWTDDGGEYATHTMQSARQAERTALSLYEKLYGSAVDLSILQIRGDPDETRWVKADIESGKRWIDVKNARRALSSSETYSEHCVPSYKEDRAGSDVVVSGFLSEYLNFEQEYAPQPQSTGGHASEADETEAESFWIGESVASPRSESGHAHEPDESGDKIVWVGEMTWSELSRLRSEFESDALSIEFKDAKSWRSGRAQKMEFLPPWIFDYPPVIYADRDKAREELEASNAVWPMAGCPPGAVVLVGAVADNLGDDPRIEESLALQDRLNRCGLSRPVLFLHCLERFCRAALGDKKTPLDHIRGQLFPSPNHFLWEELETTCEDYTTVPLGVIDPLKTVATLLDALERVQDHCMQRAIRFKSFRLRGPSILQGLDQAGHWKTILAYCGGKRRLPKGKKPRCGKNPLFIGQDKTCHDCKRLICSECGFCKWKCPPCEKRQRDSSGV